MPPPTDLKALSARSVMVSLLLGAHPEGMTAARLVTVGGHFGLTAATVRVALSRAVASGDLRREASTYHLGERLLGRRERQEQLVAPGAWDGTWEMVVVVTAGRPSAERAALRTTLAGARLAELREGVWLRPANLARPRPLAPDDAVAGDGPVLGDGVLQRFTTAPTADAVALADVLWDLPAWASEADATVALLATTREPADRLAVAAHLVRHLTTDPLLPRELWPAGWPAARARTASAAYGREIAAISRR